LIIQINKEDKSKNVGRVLINLGEFIGADPMSQNAKKTMVFEKCPDKEASIEFSVKCTLVSESASGDTLSMMSDNMSIGSGPESEFEFDDFEKNEEGKNSIRKRFGQISGRKPAN
jgi:hypothetical protein